MTLVLLIENLANGFIVLPNKQTKIKANYRIVTSTSPSRIEAHAGLFRSLMKGIFDPYVL